MKKIIFLPVSLLLLLTLIFVSCEKDSDEVCELFETPSETCSIEATYCSDGNYGYYMYDEVKYTCSDDECIDVINEIIDKAGCTASAAALKSGSIDVTKQYMSQVALRVMAEARSAAGCN